MAIRTWHAEALVAAASLAEVMVVTHGGLREAIGSAGVMLSFLHAQVAQRHAEADAAREVPLVSCHRWSARYFVAREIAWFAYFATGRCWSALVGCVLFLVYPAWRKWLLDRMRRTAGA